jgi:hypothetical protein
MCKHTVLQFQLHFSWPRGKIRAAKPLRLGRLCRPRRKIYVVAGANGRSIAVVFNPTPFWLVNQWRRLTNNPVFLDFGDKTPTERAREVRRVQLLNREMALKRASPERIAFCREILS